MESLIYKKDKQEIKLYRYAGVIYKLIDKIHIYEYATLTKDEMKQIGGADLAEVREYWPQYQHAPSLYIYLYKLANKEMTKYFLEKEAEK